jgi:hypothetical protein
LIQKSCDSKSGNHKESHSREDPVTFDSMGETSSGPGRSTVSAHVTFISNQFIGNMVVLAGVLIPAKPDTCTIPHFYDASLSVFVCHV